MFKFTNKSAISHICTFTQAVKHISWGGKITVVIIAQARIFCSIPGNTYYLYTVDIYRKKKYLNFLTVENNSTYILRLT